MALEDHVAGVPRPPAMKGRCPLNETLPTSVRSTTRCTSLRRHDPDQVRRSAARAALSAPAGAPVCLHYRPATVDRGDAVDSA